MNELFQPNSGSPGKTSVSRGDSATVNITRATENNHITGTADNSSTEDQNSKGHFCAQLSKDCDGTATQPSNRGHISIPGRNLECDRLHESCTVRENPERSQPPADRRFGKAAPRQPDQSYCSNLQHKEKARTTRATQIYLKHRELGTHPPYVVDNEEADLLIFNFVQSIMQQTQQHMFKQLEQCMQQTYSGLSLGTPVHAKEYTEQFKKNNNTVMLTKTKWLDIAPNESDWDDNQDFTSHGDTASLLPPPVDSAKTDTVLKTITPTENAFGRVQRKTNFSTGKNRSTAVISGQPAGSEDPGEYEEYFNPCIFPHQSLYTMNPVFAAAVNIRCQRPQNSNSQIEVV